MFLEEYFFLEGGIFLMKEIVQLISSGIINSQLVCLCLSALSKNIFKTVVLYLTYFVSMLSK